MARVKCQAHNISGGLKYDALPRDKSLREAVEVDLSEIIKSSGFHESKTTHSDSNHDADNSNFSTLLSHNDSHLSPFDVNACDLCVPKGSYPKPNDFLDFSCPKPFTKSMKFKDNSECEGEDFLSDLLSPVTIIKQSNHNGLPTFDDNISLSDIRIPNLLAKESSTLKQPNVKEEHYSNSSVFDLSDILSSISIDNCNQSKSSLSKNSSVENCDENLSFDNFKISNKVGHIERNDSSESNTGNLSDIFSSLDISNLNSSKSDASRRLNQSHCTNISKDVLDEGFSEFKLSKKTPVQNQASFDEFNIDDFCKVIIDDKREKKENKNMTFSFFPDISKKNSPFSPIPDKDESPTHEHYSSSGDSGISMLDFLSSIDNSKESTSTSEDDADKNFSRSLSCETPEDEMEAVDLNFCIKTIEDKLIVESPSSSGNCNSSPKSKRFENENPGSLINPLPLKHSVNPVTSSKGMKQSLFSKSLSCKPKRDPILHHKVANIKAGLLNQAFGCSTAVNFHLLKPLPNVASYSDNPTITHAGRRLFNSVSVTTVC